MSEEVKAISGVLLPTETVYRRPSPEAVKPRNQRLPFAVSVRRCYEGPLDLLLDLIRKQDIDIYDIPIARITAQYLTYVERMRELDVNVAADFIYMAAVLIHIKSKMLLPRDPLAPPTRRTIRAANWSIACSSTRSSSRPRRCCMQKQQIEDAVWSNPALKEFMDAEGTEPELAADVIDLVKTFQQILDRARSRPILEVDEETVTVGQMIDYLQRRLSLEDRPLRLKQMLRNVDSRQALVCMFLAMLELVRLQAIQLRQDRMFRRDSDPQARRLLTRVMNEQAAVRDD